MTSSRLLKTLDAAFAAKSTPELESESEIEIFGPFTSKQNSNPQTGNKKRATAEIHPDGTSNGPAVLKSIHPLFIQNSYPKTRVDPGPSKKPLSTRNNDDKATASTCGGTAKPAVRPSSKTNAVPRAKKPISKSSLEPTEALPLYTYKDYTDPKPCLVHTTDEEEANDFVAGLKAGPVAFDMEWRVFFARGAKVSERRTAVVQVADARGMMLVVQVHGMNRMYSLDVLRVVTECKTGFPKALQALIEDPEIPKLGVNILNDGKKLFRDYGILAKNLVELGAIAAAADPDGPKRRIVSLSKLTERYCGKTLDKGSERVGNWEAPLDQQQLEYAANDVHSSLMIYARLRAVAAEHNVTLILSDPQFATHVEPPVPSTGLGPTPEPIEMRGQFMRAYRCWHERDMTLEHMCKELSLKGRVPGVEGKSGEGLKAGTVISYVISALQANPKLPFDMLKLRELVQMDSASWVRHREWLLSAWAEGLGKKE
ncbi:hypothetical protein H0H81_011128 [Sphagnurus paluster]|uniref:3'-5' exonuclease domain-containing protein n=1 Tax=Sphagnurus paluster TaxID=117069 RepID=A0A9P7GPB8_9AGAR|nr:hypothetical protein H0H81_011128 [Sphagnurus paluster]